MNRIHRWTLVAVALVFVLGLPPAPAGAAVSCLRTGMMLSVVIGPSPSNVTLVRDGAAIEVRSGADAIGCTGGASRVGNTNSIALDNFSGQKATVTVSLAGGPFAPGATTGDEGPSPEIEIDLGMRQGDRVRIQGTRNADRYALGSDQGGLGVNLNGDNDVDVSISGNVSAIVIGGGGRDSLLATGGVGFDGAASRPLTLRGGAGVDVLAGGSARDTLSGAGKRDIIIGGADNDRLRGGGGNDDLSGKGGDDSLVGGPGDDVLRGGPGMDGCAGGPGRDRAIGCES
jgi:Ca2+-binding RTX toxin-like protein